VDEGFEIDRSSGEARLVLYAAYPRATDGAWASAGSLLPGVPPVVLPGDRPVVVRLRGGAPLQEFAPASLLKPEGKSHVLRAHLASAFGVWRGILYFGDAGLHGMRLLPEAGEIGGPERLEEAALGMTAMLGRPKQVGKSRQWRFPWGEVWLGFELGDQPTIVVSWI
jgi:hypothetical protein